MTYADLLEELQKLTVKQLEKEITVEDPYEDEWYFAELRICDEAHAWLETDYPVIYMVM